MGRWGDGEITCLFPVPCSLFPVPYSLFPVTYYLLPTPLRAS
ncbi:hypothetical protein [Moorena sp. SIO4A5]|nr:hypothetical protein [Moorena sp. SIO4A5]